MLMIGVTAYELPTRGGEMTASQIEDQNEQQQQQPANHSFNNAEIARCLTPSSIEHGGTKTFSNM